MTEQHTDKCCYWDDPEFCDCGSREIDRLTSQLTSAKEEIERLKQRMKWKRQTAKMNWDKFREEYTRAEAAESALASERMETERLREPYRVSVQKMKESHRVTWWVCLDRPDRPMDAKPWDKGRITPYMSEDKEKADFIAQEWAEFLGTTIEAALQSRQGEE